MVACRVVACVQAQWRVVQACLRVCYMGMRLERHRLRFWQCASRRLDCWCSSIPACFCYKVSCVRASKKSPQALSCLFCWAVYAVCLHIRIRCLFMSGGFNGCVQVGTRSSEASSIEETMFHVLEGLPSGNTPQVCSSQGVCSLSKVVCFGAPHV